MSRWVKMDGVYYNSDIIRKIYVKEREFMNAPSEFSIIIENNRYDLLSDLFGTFISNEKFKNLEDAETALSKIMGV